MINQINEDKTNNHNCSVCLKEDLDEDQIYFTNCNHEFCKECLDDWFQRGNKSCPLCRNEVSEYKHKDEKYKLIIHTVELETSPSQLNLNELINHNILVRNIVKQNFKLRFYTFTLLSLFLYTVNIYFYNLQDMNKLSKDLEICSLNNTNLQDDLNQCELFSDPDLGNGYYVGMFNGELTRRCFYPSKFYNICFNK